MSITMTLRQSLRRAPVQPSATPQLFINGRFLSQTLSGVQRFAYEMTRELMQIWPQDAGSPLVLRPTMDANKDVPFQVRPVGQRTGVPWEQLELPRSASSGLLLNLANTAPLLGKRQAVVIHDVGAFETPQAYSFAFRSYYRLLQKGMARRDIKIATVSEFSKLSIARHLGISHDRIGVISEGSDHMHRLISADATLTRHQLNMGGYVLAVGNLSHHKNLAGLSEVARMLDRRGTPLVIAGQINPIFDSGGTVLPEPARYLGRVSDAELKALYEGAACFVFPSLYEGFGLPAVEAMACRCAVLASRIPGLQETCADAALYFDPTSPTDIAEKVARVLDEPGLAERLRQAGTDRAGEITWAKSAQALKAWLLPELEPVHPAFSEANWQVNHEALLEV